MDGAHYAPSIQFQEIKLKRVSPYNICTIQRRLQVINRTYKVIPWRYGIITCFKEHLSERDATYRG